MNQLNRFKLLIGESNLENIINTKVLVLGLGGVGSYSVESLVRSGIGTVILVDYDKVDITNLNRQLMTDHSNIGLLKTDVWEDRIKKINPSCKVIKINQKINEYNLNILFDEKPDYLIDACDTLIIKKLLITKCHQERVRLIESMGTANKFDPSKLKIMDIRKTSYDPLAKALRKYIVDNKINYKVMVVSSDEKPLKICNPVGSNSFVPSTAGLLCSSYVINDIIKSRK